MAEESLRKLWLALAIISFAFAVAVFSQLQGGPLEILLKPLLVVVIKDGTPRAIVAMWGIYLLGIFTALSHYVLWTHARAAEPDWKTRYPFRLFDQSVYSDLGSKAQNIAFAVLTLAPMYPLGRFWVVLAKKGILCTRSKPGTPHVLDKSAGPFGLPSDWSWSRAFVDEYRLADMDGKACGDATTWFPMLSPFLLALVTLASVYWLVRAMRALFRPSVAGQGGI